MTPRFTAHLAPKPAALTLVALLATAVLARPALSAVPHQAIIEGALTSSGGGAVVDGSYPLVYALYGVKAGGTALWSEGASTDVFGGSFVHTLGSTKPLPVAVIASAKELWLGLKVGSDPELPRQRVWAAPYALVAEMAESATHAKTADSAKSADLAAVANSAKALACTGCVSLKALKIDGDLDLAGNALKAKNVTAATVSATSFLGDGSKLTGIKIPSGSCKTAGEVVKGIAADGTLICVKSMDPNALPGDGLVNISNGVLSNFFDDTLPGKGKIAISDNNPTGISSELIVPDLGTAVQLDVHVALVNSDLATVQVYVFDPNNVAYTLWDKSAKGKALDGLWPSKNKVVAGDLTSWVGKNPKGKWRLKVVDTGFLNNGFDGELTTWSVVVRTLANKKVLAKGDILLQDPTGAQLPAARVARKYAPALADGAKLLLDSGAGVPGILAQAWFYDVGGKSWVQANAGSAGVSCSACGTGSDGNYTATTNVSLPAKVYNFKNFTIAKGVTVTVTGTAALHIKATEKVDIQGTLVLNGGNGSNVTSSSNGCLGGNSTPGVGGPGGYDGGYGVYSSSSSGFYDGKGPGAGKKGVYNWNGGCGSGGGGASYGSSGAAGTGSGGAAGATYAGITSDQLIGGSGGGAGGYGSAYNATGAGGGGGGGAVRIDAPDVTVAGKISANGGAGGGQYNNCDGGASGGGSGGGIWIRGGRVVMAGSSLTATGGAGGILQNSTNCGAAGGKGGDGRIRVDALSLVSNGSATPAISKGATTGLSLPLTNRFRLDQPQPGQVQLTNESGQTQQVWLVVSW